MKGENAKGTGSRRVEWHSPALTTRPQQLTDSGRGRQHKETQVETPAFHLRRVS